MAELNIPRAHSNSWYDNLAEVQAGYYYPWQSTIGDNNGEQAYLTMLQNLVTKDMTVMDVGCGHGDVVLDLAPLCNKIIGYDRIQTYIDLANANAAARNISNAEFQCYDAIDNTSGDARLPAEDNSLDMIICRRGPLHWISDAKRACKDGAILLSLSPMEEPVPHWTQKLPQVLHYENSGRHTGTGSIQQSVENRLHQAGLMLHSGWSFDVPEVFDDPQELYNVLKWGVPAEEIPPFEDLEFRFKDIYETAAEPEGIVLRHCRFLWKALIQK